MFLFIHYQTEFNSMFPEFKINAYIRNSIMDLLLFYVYEGIYPDNYRFLVVRHLRGDGRTGI
jgi:hypothetical protein